jgi:DNA-binding response OmpR family regulator
VLKGRAWDGLDRTVDQLVSRLRRKIDCRSTSGALQIRPVRGIGYLLSSGS